jgi:hypothetical protein
MIFGWLALISGRRRLEQRGIACVPLMPRPGLAWGPLTSRPGFARGPDHVRAWDDQFYPDGVGAWMAKLDVADDGSTALDQRFFVEGEAFRGRRAHQVRLQGGDASSDSGCFSS